MRVRAGDGHAPFGDLGAGCPVPTGGVRVLRALPTQHDLAKGQSTPRFMPRGENSWDFYIVSHLLPAWDLYGAPNFLRCNSTVSNGILLIYTNVSEGGSPTVTLPLVQPFTPVPSQCELILVQNRSVMPSPFALSPGGRDCARCRVMGPLVSQCFSEDLFFRQLMFSMESAPQVLCTIPVPGGM